MRGSRIAGIVAVIAALHVAVLSFVFGPRHIGYMLVASLSAALTWGVVFFLNERKRRAGFISGMILGLVVQVVAYRILKAELPGFWWPLAQFGALQFLVAYGIVKAGP